MRKLQRRAIIMSRRRLKEVSNETPNDVLVVRTHNFPLETPNNVAVVRLHHVLKLRCLDVLLVDLYYVFELLCHDFHVVDFDVSFNYQIRQQILLVPIRKETRRVVWILH